MSTQEETPELNEALLAGINAQLEELFSGRSPGVILITFGPHGRTTLAGDVAQIVLALETAKALVVTDAIQRSLATSQRTAQFFSAPTAGNA